MSTHHQVRAAWDTNADHWDEHMAEGNTWHTYLIEPTMLRLLNLRPGQRLLDIGCGNGQFARKMVSLGASVFATDFSTGQIRNAERRSATLEPAERLRLTFACLDLASPSELKSIPNGPFDAIVSTMAFMDMPAVEPVFQAAPRLLNPNGRLVFSQMHPCFNSMGTSLVVEEFDQGGRLVRSRSVRVEQYRQPFEAKGMAMVGQPVPHWYFHRSLADLPGQAFAAGLVMDGIEEPIFPDEAISTDELSWSQFREIYLYWRSDSAQSQRANVRRLDVGTAGQLQRYQ